MERNNNSLAAPNRRAPSGCAQDTATPARSATAPAARPLRRRPAPFRRKEVAMPRGQRLLIVAMWGATSMLGCGETPEDGVFDPMASTGGSLRQLFGLGGFNIGPLNCNSGMDANPAPGATIFAGRLT